MSTSVFAGYWIDDSEYYYNDDTESIEHTDESGRKVSESLYTWADMLNGYILAGGENDKMCILDKNLDVLIPMEYDKIEYNANTDTYICIKDSAVDFYNGLFNKVTQPVDISPIETTDYYKLSVIDESSGKHYYYICDADGNKLIDEAYTRIDSGGGSIIADNSGKYGVYNNELEIAIPFDYFYISYDNGTFHCKGHEKDVYISENFETADGIEQINGTPYFRKKGNGVLYYICDFNGNTLNDKGYYRIESSSTENKILCYLNESVDVYDNNLNYIETRKSEIIFVTPIKGMADKFIYNKYPDDPMNTPNSCVIDEQGNILSNMYTSIQPNAYPGGTLIVESPAGHSDTETSVLDSEFNVIAGPSFGYMYVKEENDAIYIENVWTGSNTKYYDLYGNQYKTKAEAIAAAQTHGEASPWAKESIIKAIEAGIVPEEIQSQYIRKITRQEFCKLAVMTYISKTNYTIAENSESPFGDVNDSYVTAAYDLNIVAGRGNGIFAPKDSITRQEAAVMLNNLAKLLNIEVTEKTDKFVDESYFADWAKDAIYSVASMKSGDTYVMAGTGEGKFSPWMNYTREQAIATMYRLFVL